MTDRSEQILEDADTALRISRGVDRLKRENEAFRSANASLDKRVHELRDLVHYLGSRAVLVCDELQDEDDRCYLGSTNHADVLRKMKQSYDEYRMETDDMGADDALSENGS
jgi:uncharacterized coiled-coil DUF342 family protein